MKFFIVLLFAITAPLTIFLTTILFSSDINNVLKTELAKDGVYDKLSQQITTFGADDPESQAINYFIKQKFTSSYIQTKAEGAIDSSSAWITGKSEIKPVLSFKDLKEDILTQNPGLMSSIEQMATEVKNQPVDANDPSSADMQKSIDSMTSLAKSDFTINLDQYLIGVKNFYSTLRILVPVLGLLLVLYLFLLFKLSQSFSSRMKWISTALILSSVLGFGTLLLNKFLISALTAFAATNDNQIVLIASPIVLQIIKYFVNSYLMYQGIASGVFLLGAVICLVVAGLHNDTAPTVQKVVAKPKTIKKK